MFKTKNILEFMFICCLILVLSVSNAYADDVLVTVRTKAASLLLGLKPLIFVLAGFGLIGFAWMAIFNQISWKWFSNIAIGCFLVGNMGLFIDYFVTKDGNRGTYAAMLESPSFGDYMAPDYNATGGTGSSPVEQKPKSEEGTGGKSSSDELGDEHKPAECPEGSKIVGGKCVPDETPKP